MFDLVGHLLLQVNMFTVRSLMSVLPRIPVLIVCAILRAPVLLLRPELTHPAIQPPPPSATISDRLTG